ncbi:AzlC family ABC transporter permease [Faunimonas sp. B44]|uniref:AzlC family ABC transporter permease n=1 Tax=Faunimonas sp. B44 TaxID=3461493 RepID=UPI004043C79C
MAPIAVAASPFGMVFGALAAQRGMPFEEIMLMSMIVYAGASQFVALELWRFPLPVWTIILSVLAVNFRMVLYSAALGRKLREWPLAGRLGAFAFLTDPLYALAEMAGPRLGAAYYFGMALLLYASWQAATALGALFGSLIEDPHAVGLDFVLTAYFTALLVGFRHRRNAVPVVVASAAAAVAVHALVGSPWHMGAGALAGIAVAAILADRPRRAA